MRERDYIQFGPPAEVVIEHVEYESGADGKKSETRYIERVKGVSTSTGDGEAAARDSGDFHHTTCQGRAGVARTYERDGRLWCAGCYAMKYGEEPPADLEYKVRRRPKAPRAPLSELDKAMRNFRL